MHVVEYGSGSQIAFGLHGWGGDHRTFAPLRPFVPNTWRLLAPDLPGYGSSPMIERFSIERVAESLATIVETLASDVVIVGSCSGAVLALEVALLVPQHIVRIVALDLFAYMPWYFRFFTSEPIGSIAYRLTFDSALGRRIVNAALRMRRTERSDLMASFADKSAQSMRAYLKALARLPGPERYRNVNVTVALVYGERTFRAVRRSIPTWQRTLQRADVFCMAGAGHLLLDEAPEKVAQIVFDVA